MNYYAVVDCDNCYVSCERVFRPDLQRKPVVVLSNNDGCVVARSNEAKRLGIKAGTPYYQLRRQFPEGQVAAFSSNYELYAEMTARVMSLVRKAAPQYFRYSIDEAFCILPAPGGDVQPLRQWAASLQRQILRWTAMPVSIGIARNKTIAKLASHFAKKYPGYRHVCAIHTPEQLSKALSLTPIDDVWGIGRHIARQLIRQHIETALQFAQLSPGQVRQYPVTLQRTWRELNGQDCVPNQQEASKKTITTSRTLQTATNDIGTLATHIANFAAIAAKKLRQQHTVAAAVSVYLLTNPFREDLPQHNPAAQQTLLTPTNSTADIARAAEQLLRQIHRPAFLYKKAGVTLSQITPDTSIQTNFINFTPQQYRKQQSIDKIADKINKKNGRQTIQLAAQQYPAQPDGTPTDYTDAIRHQYRSPSPTTRWNDIIALH